MACTPKIDGSSPEAFERSIEKMGKDMTPEQRRQFGADVAAASDLGNMTLAHVFDPRLGEQLKADIRKQLDGKTLQEIQVAAEAGRAAMRERKVEDARKQLAELEAALDGGIRSRSELSKVAVLSEGQYVGEANGRPAVRINVRNDSTYTLRGMMVSTPGTKDERIYLSAEQAVPAGATGTLLTPLDNFKGSPAFPIAVQVFTADVTEGKRDFSVPMSPSQEEGLKNQITQLKQGINEVLQGR
jgi:hypothetical protein